MIRVELPYHLRVIAEVELEVQLKVDPPVTTARVLDELEIRYPMLRGMIRDYATGQRRPYLRLFACHEDWSNHAQDAPLPEEVVAGAEPLIVIGAVAGG